MITCFGNLTITSRSVVRWGTKNGKKKWRFFLSFLYIHRLSIQSRNQNLQIVRHVDYYQIYQNKNATFLCQNPGVRPTFRPSVICKLKKAQFIEVFIKPLTWLTHFFSKKYFQRENCFSLQHIWEQNTIHRRLL